MFCLELVLEYPTFQGCFVSTMILFFLGFFSALHCGLSDFFDSIFVCISYCKQSFIHLKKKNFPGRIFDAVLSIIIE